MNNEEINLPTWDDIFNVANYTSDSQGFGIQLGYPISDIQRIGINLTYDKTDIDEGTLPVRDILDFLSTEGNAFQTLSAQAVWSRITLNRGMFFSNSTI